MKNSKYKINPTIHCIVGDSDPFTRNYAKGYRRWDDYSKSKTKLNIIKGANHYFLKHNSDELASIIIDTTKNNTDE